MAKKKKDPRAVQFETERRMKQEGRGRDAEKPSQFPVLGWKDIFWRVVAEISEDRVSLVAAGTAFYLILALFPALAAFVSLYGFVADPQVIAEQIAFLGQVLPDAGLDLVRSQLESLAEQDTNALSFGFIFGLLVALWSANNGVKTLFQAMNVAYEETEKRSFAKLNLMALAFTVGAMLFGSLFIVFIGLIPAALALFNLDAWTEMLVRVLRWPIMLLAVVAGITLIYRYGPSREKAQGSWLTWGAGLATIVWVAASIAFSFYLENFANYNATYGTLGVAIGFMMWMWISAMILIVGAELNAEMEHQTAKDTTTGEPQPIGARGAMVADTLGRTAEGSKGDTAADKS